MCGTLWQNQNFKQQDKIKDRIENNINSTIINGNYNKNK